MPDEIVPWLSPMSEAVMDKSLKPASPLFRVLEAVEDFRVFSPDWYADGIDLTLYLVLSVGELAPLAEDDELPPITPALGVWLSGKQRTATELAQRLFPEDGGRPSASDRDALWRALGNLFRSMGFDKAQADSDPNVRAAVTSFVVEVAGEDELTMLEFRKSDQLDLAHLSGADGPDS